MAPAEVQPSPAVVWQGLTEGLQQVGSEATVFSPSEEIPFPQAIALVPVSSEHPAAGKLSSPWGKGKQFPPLTVLLPEAPISLDTPAHLQSPAGFIRGERTGVSGLRFLPKPSLVLALPAATALTWASPGGVKLHLSTIVLMGSHSREKDEKACVHFNQQSPRWFLQPYRPCWLLPGQVHSPHCPA